MWQILTDPPERQSNVFLAEKKRDLIHEIHQRNGEQFYVVLWRVNGDDRGELPPAEQTQ